VKYKIVQHAESNAIVNCARSGATTANCTMYCTHFPCASCAGKIIQAGILSLVVDKKAADPEFNKRWEEDFKLSKLILAEAGVVVIEI